MLVDTKGLTKDLEGKTLRVRFNDGTEDLVKLECVITHDCHESCNGFVYQPLSMSAHQLFEKMKGEHPHGFSCWGNFQDVVSWEIVEGAQTK